MLKRSKNESIFERETYRGVTVVIVYFLMSRALEDGTWGWGGVLMSVTGLGQFEVFTWCGLSLIGTGGLVFAVVAGKRQICHIFVVCACMLVKHCKPVKVILRFLLTSRVLYQIFD